MSDKLTNYINQNYPTNPLWFTEEVKQPYNAARIAKVLDNRNYFKGLHDVIQTPDVQHKGTTFKTSKMILQTIKTIINFHSTYILGKPVNLIGNPRATIIYSDTYRRGKYAKTNFSIIDNLLKYGDVFEYVFLDGDGKIKSKLIDSADAYPVYDSKLDYVGFIEFYQDVVNKIEFYTVYNMTSVETWENKDGQLTNTNSFVNITGLPIHYKNSDDLFGHSVLEDLKPVIDKIETVINRLDDSVYTLSMNPVGVLSGQQLQSSANAEAIGFVLGLEDGGDFKWAVANLDSASCSLLLNTLFNQLWTIAQVPSIVMGQSNVSNVSEVSLKLLFTLANNKGLENAIYMRDGFISRHEAMERILNKFGIDFTMTEYIDVEFNLNRPTDDKEFIDMLSVQFKDGALSRETYIDKSPIITDSAQEKERLGMDSEKVSE
jgi:SPP1 family phage portal protein